MKSKVLTIALLLGGTQMFAQPQAPGAPPPPPERRAPFAGIGPDFVPGPIVPGGGFMGRGSLRSITGAPFSATAVTQFTRTLSDGNKISRTQTVNLARDGQGRTREEIVLQANANNNDGANANRELITIHDPVAGATYILTPGRQTALELKRPPRPQPPPGPNGVQPSGRGRGPQSPGGQNVNPQNVPQIQRRDTPNVKTESLGTQVVGGVMAEGRRTTRTIPAGAQGNQNPINIVTETWYSPELQLTVLSKTSDPLHGDTTYGLTNLVRAEPDPTLFQVPPSYTVRQLPGRGHGGPPPTGQNQN